MAKPAAILVLKSANRKIGKAAATYASIESTCLKDCAFRNNGCYAQSGPVYFTVSRLDRSGATALEAAKQEAAAIDAADDVRGLALRLHVSGDSSTPRAASIVGDAARRWRSRGGDAVWSYTHAWRKVPRSSWGDAVSVLASCESFAQGPMAIEQGYAPAVIVDQHPADGKSFDRFGIRWIPCPQQTRGTTCTECRLCFHADALRMRGAGISFEAHGTGYRRVLNVIQPNLFTE